MNASVAHRVSRSGRALLWAAALSFFLIGARAEAESPEDARLLETALDDAQAAYERGDLDAAAELWQELATQGSAAAQFRLGESYVLGQGVPIDDALAVGWLLKSADQDYPNAQFALGFMHMNAIGIGKDAVQALKWFRLCARHAGFAYFGGKNAELVVDRMTPEQIAEADGLAAAWRPKAP